MKKFTTVLLLAFMMPFFVNTSAMASNQSTSAQVQTLKKSLTKASIRYETQSKNYLARAESDAKNRKHYLNLAESYLVLAQTAKKLASSLTSKNLKYVRNASIEMHMKALDNFKYKQKFIK